MIASNTQERLVLDVIQPVAAGLGMEIVRVRIGGGNRPQLQVMAERSGGAPTDVEDCAKLSRAISPALDAADPITGAYTLEVSTPGIDRPLTRAGDFGRWAGHLAKIELARPLDGRRRFQGIITGEGEDGVRLLLDDETELIAEVDEMSKAALVLTDTLIEEARRRGGLPVQPDDPDFADYDLDDDDAEDDPTTDDNDPESNPS